MTPGRGERIITALDIGSSKVSALIALASPEGELRVSYGSSGHGPGEFNTVHSVFIDHGDGDRVYAADRYNNRVQYFTPEQTEDHMVEWKNVSDEIFR